MLSAASFDIVLFCAQAAAIVLEAMPFLLAGSILGACVDVWLTPERVAKYVPSSRAGSICAGLFAGVLLPTCECGVVPVVRRLLGRGVPSGAAFAYLLAGPVVNPVVIASTWFAFKGDWTLLAARLGMTLVTAGCTAAVLAGIPPTVALRAHRGNSPAAMCGCGCGHDHHDGCSHDAGGEPLPVWARIARSASREFIAMSQFLVLGALAAAAFRSFVPGSVVQSLSGNLPLAVLGMMSLAVLLSICSEADAFVAASFSSFPWPALAAFTVIGPMMDLKLLPMFWATFHPRVATVLTVLPFLLVAILSLALGLLAPLGGQP
ncbi:permease [Megalodesulfovibrio gigas]|uniref:Putative permease n=1 Tax=Megalodesulfovibrio gigas (strain ATCC 19364 / DSM 1382 / NCIMB 9332 / VKM B-1759) TaxID=1121448 RepID=T2GAU8_MEGG1|nr:permease [Megalodesulfovibrio gigas]AGW13032.1 putative permease [Megalodesulfovibrio gigas DSM 1382 = ATCC 19364]